MEIGRKATVTLNITASDIRLLVTRGGRVRSWAKESLPEGVVAEGLIAEPKTVAAAIGSILGKASAPKKRISVCLGGLPFSYRTITLPRLQESAMREAVVRSAKKELPLPPDEVYLAWQGVGSQDGKRDFFVAGVGRKPVDALAETLSLAGISQATLEVAGLCLARAANRGDAVIVSVEADSFDAILVAGGLPVMTYSMKPRQEGASALDNAQRLAEQISRMLQFYANSHPEGTVGPGTPLVVTGEHSSDTDLVEFLATMTGHPAETLKSPLKAPNDLPLGQYAANLGLALKGTAVNGRGGFHDVNLDFLAARRPPEDRRSLGPQVAAVLSISVALALLAPGYQAWSQAASDIEDMRTELTASMRQLSQNRAANRKVEQLEGTIQELRASTDALGNEHLTIVGRDDGSAATLILLRTSLPDGAQLSSVALGTDRVTVRGTTATPSSVVAYADALENTEAYADVRIAEMGESSPTLTNPTPGILFSIIIVR